MARRDTRGFTLIELLVVIAIIGMLSSVVLSSLNGARQKARDARRLADFKQLQAALELYYSDNVAYPESTTQANAITALTDLTPNYIASVPDDPLGGSYHYVYKTTSGGTYYCLAAVYEGATNPASSCNTTSLGSSMTGSDLYSVGP